MTKPKYVLSLTILALTVFPACMQKFEVANQPNGGTTPATLQYLSENPIDNLTRQILDPNSDLYKGDPQVYARQISEAYAALPKLSTLVDNALLPAVMSKSSGPASGRSLLNKNNFQKRDAVGDPGVACIPRDVAPPGGGGGRCPNVCVMAAAFAAAVACASAEAEACASCWNSDGSGITVCAWARSEMCSYAFGFGFAAACSNGGGVGGGGGIGGVDGEIDVGVIASGAKRSLFDGLSADPVACPVPSPSGSPSPTPSPSVSPSPTVTPTPTPSP